MPVGTALVAADVEVRRVAAEVAPDALRTVDDAVGRSASVPLSPGTALQPSLLAAGELASAAPDGTVVAAVRLDPGVAALLAAGDRVDLLVASGSAEPSPGASRGRPRRDGRTPTSRATRSSCRDAPRRRRAGCWGPPRPPTRPPRSSPSARRRRNASPPSPAGAR
ncbi:hypothetical protein BJF88_10160 [Cellulosimicrobium sp. CUA-896]|nr:hypothetical protein BJF88_10160 [Cellulosimicrobium sp. CUA-896]